MQARRRQALQVNASPAACRGPVAGEDGSGDGELTGCGVEGSAVGCGGRVVGEVGGENLQAWR